MVNLLVEMPENGIGGVYRRYQRCSQILNDGECLAYHEKMDDMSLCFA
jgi:hypothetical protein